MSNLTDQFEMFLKFKKQERALQKKIDIENALRKETDRLTEIVVFIIFFIIVMVSYIIMYIVKSILQL